ncbi:alpha/beta fold hydrolase [Streptomyces sp. NPDC020792]|uniref:alpha/beta fold hydrolase n=1 Tax=Streptomyces sp. NPDC020792 TaxID=3365089 RepID=UPI003791A81D
MQKRPVLLIHGMGSSYRHNWVAPGWADLLHESGREVIGVELPGHGVQGRAGDPTRVAADVLLEAASKSAPVDAIGFSAGGYALMVAASRQPELFGAVALLGVADSGLRESRVGEVAMNAIAACLESEEEPADGMGRLMRRLIDTAGNDRAAVAAFVRSRQPYAGADDLAAVSARCLVVEGGADTSGPADRIAASIPRSSRVVLKGVDHFAIPGDVGCIDAVLRFLDEE